MQRPRPYHHGNLKEALLIAAVKVLGRKGPRAFTLREVARLAKVSHNAPYRHFRDKDELLAAVAAQGFERLADTMIAAADPARNALEALELSGRSYVQFALDWPEHFSAMFDQPRDLSNYPVFAASGRRAFEVLLGNIVAAQSAGQLPAGDANALALTAWSMVHGIAKLAIGGSLPFASQDAILQFTEFSASALSKGLSLVDVAGKSPVPRLKLQRRMRG